jgi:cell division protein FtsQ
LARRPRLARALRALGARLRERLAETALGRLLERVVLPLAVLLPGRKASLAICLALFGAAAAHLLARGGYVDALAAQWRDTRDVIANAGGFRIAAVAISGNRQVTREEILAIAGVTGRTSLPFLDVEQARQRLRANPWIADATVLKLYPDRLQIVVTERQPFALWQVDGRVFLIAEDGTVLEPYVARRFVELPFVVGRGAQRQVKEIVALLDRQPALRQEVRAAVLVAERRWNLHLKNGLVVLLPEEEVAPALERLLALDRDKQLLSRDLAVIDLRLPDRVTVRLSDDAAKARAEALQSLRHKRGGGRA